MPNVTINRGWDIFVYFQYNNWNIRLPYENSINNVAMIEGESHTTPNIHNNDIN